VRATPSPFLRRSALADQDSSIWTSPIQFPHFVVVSFSFPLWTSAPPLAGFLPDTPLLVGEFILPPVFFLLLFPSPFCFWEKFLTLCVFGQVRRSCFALLTTFRQFAAYRDVCSVSPFLLPGYRLHCCGVLFPPPWTSPEGL